MRAGTGCAGERSVDPDRVRGRTADLVASRPLPFVGCRPASLPEGTNRIRAIDGSALRVDTLVLADDGPQEPRAVRSLAIDRWDREHRSLILGPGDQAVLTTDENVNRGWVATLGGERLAPFTADGWRQGWVVPAGAGGEVVLRFEAGRPYDLALQAGLVLAALTLIALLVPGRTDAAPSGTRRIPGVVVLVAGTLALAAATGLWALAVPLLWHRVRSRRLLPIAVVCLLVATAASVLGALDWLDWFWDRRWVSSLEQVLMTVVLGAVFVRVATPEQET